MATTNMNNRIDEMTWRKEFAKVLHNKLKCTGITEEQLAAETRISRIIISKYLNQRATPSGYNLNLIAKCLNCPVSELVDIRW